MSAAYKYPAAPQSLAPLEAWQAIKDQLRRKLEKKEWEMWIRHARLTSYSEAKGPYRAAILITMPRKGNVLYGAMRHLNAIRRLAGKKNLDIMLTVEPAAWQVEQWRIQKNFVVTYLEPPPSELWDVSV